MKNNSQNENKSPENHCWETKMPKVTAPAYFYK